MEQPKPAHDTSLWRDPYPPPKRWLDESQGRLLDPATALAVDGVTPYSTVYVGPRLLVSPLFDAATLVDLLDSAASALGWTVVPDVPRDELPGAPRRRRGRALSDAGSRIVPIGVTIAVADTNAAAKSSPDAWVVLQQARRQHGVAAMQGVGLDHLIVLRPGAWGPNPGAWGPNPGAWGPNPGAWGPNDNPSVSYAMPGFGGRQPVAYVGPPPLRCKDSAVTGRRPVVAILDTGCGKHPWLKDVVQVKAPSLAGGTIGYTDDKTDPEIYPDQAGGLDGVIDPYSGHGTFICGLIHQACPDAKILAWRAVGSAGPIRESELLQALQDILDLVEAHRADPKKGRPIDVLSLSLGYYHETPEDEQIDPTVWELMRRFGAAGTQVVCSAGNDATARPMFPAAFAPWLDGKDPIKPDPAALPVVSVGALNPSGATDALFSNAGPWVRDYQRGAAVMSTLPETFQGGLQSIARTEAYQRPREGLDPDDFTGGFAVWSGTSFAAPLLAGKLAAHMAPGLLRGPVDESATAAKRRAWTALLALTELKREDLRRADRRGALRKGRRGK